MLPLQNSLETDILIIGGGIAGLMAAISARRHGVKVLVVEKADTRRSGSGASGNDHFLCYIPEKHGHDLNVILHEFGNSLFGSNMDMPLATRFLNKSFSIVKLWHDWGINMRLFDDWTFMGHAFPGKPRIFLKYDGHNQKAVLTKKAQEVGVKILNHHTVLDLIHDEQGARGALALDTTQQEPTFKIIRAKNTLFTTGSGNRLFPSGTTPGILFNISDCPSCTSASIAQSWRVGGKLVNMELSTRHAGPRYFSRGGKNTWIGVYRYPDGKNVGPFVQKATREVGDITGDVWNTSFTELMLKGTGPVYMDCSDSSAEDHTFMREGMLSEGLSGFVNHMENKHIDPKKHMVEFGQYEPYIVGQGIQIDINAQSSIPGLYSAGESVGNFRADMAGAAVYGWIAGEEAALACPTRALATVADAGNNDWCMGRMLYYSQFHERKQGADWREANLALQRIMGDYAAPGPDKVRSESLLNAGMTYLGQLRKNMQDELCTPCSHTLMRATEVLDLLDCAEATMHAALERRETRGLHMRSDFTFTNPLLNNKFLEVWQENGYVQTHWRDKLIK